MRTIVLTTAILLAATMSAWGDAAEQAKRDFDELFGSQVHQAQKASRPDEDLKLASQILDAARGASISPELMTLLCAAVCDLSGNTPAGQELAIQAAELLTKASPDKALYAQRKLLEVSTRLYSAASGETKTQAGRDCIEKLLSLAEAQTPAGDLSQAASDLKTAERIATQIGAESIRPIRAKIQLLDMTAAGTKKAAQLHAKFKTNPVDAATREALIKVLLLELDRPAEAATYLSSDSDVTLRTNIPLAAGVADDLPAEACIELSRWYDALAETASGAGVPNALRRARTYCRRFLDTHPDKDAHRLFAQAQLKKLDAAMDKYEPKPEWTNVLVLVDLTRHVRWGTWAWNGSALGITKGAPRTRLIIPAIPDGDYEIAATFARTEGLGSTRFYLPVGNSTCMLVLGADKAQICGLDRVAGTDATTNATRTLAPALAGPARHTVLAKVIRRSDKAEIAVTLDGNDLFTWTGASGDLSRPPEWSLSDTESLGLGASDTRVVYHSVQVRMLSGSLKRSTPDESAARRGDAPRIKKPPRIRVK